MSDTFDLLNDFGEEEDQDQKFKYQSDSQHMSDQPEVQEPQLIESKRMKSNGGMPSQVQNSENLPFSENQMHDEFEMDDQEAQAHDSQEGEDHNNEEGVANDNVMSENEMNAEGFFSVKQILKHKYHQGWRFLTIWEGYPLNASTWEPTKAFKLPDGRLNSKFREYCEQNGLSDILRRALK